MLVDCFLQLRQKSYRTVFSGVPLLTSWVRIGTPTNLDAGFKTPACWCRKERSRKSVLIAAWPHSPPFYPTAQSHANADRNLRISLGEINDLGRYRCPRIPSIPETFGPSLETTGDLTRDSLESESPNSTSRTLGGQSGWHPDFLMTQEPAHRYGHWPIQWPNGANAIKAGVDGPIAASPGRSILPAATGTYAWPTSKPANIPTR